MQKYFLLAAITVALFLSCKKETEKESQVDHHSSQLIIDRNKIQFRVIKGTTSVGHIA